MIAGPAGLLVAFVAGLLSCLSPCVLPLVPVYISHLGTTGRRESPSTEQTPRQTLVQHALAFVAGFTLVFVALGVSAGAIGSLLQAHLLLLQRLSGAAMIVMGISLLGLVRVPWLMREWALRRPPAGTGYLRSFSVGTMLSLGWTPCVGPTLGAILALAAASRTVVQAGWLLFVYSMGLAVPFLLTAMALAPIDALLSRFRRGARTVELAGAIVLIVTGMLIIGGVFTRLNAYFQFNGFAPKL
jgi:cytochrome c-type biogenesis protein